MKQFEFLRIACRNPSTKDELASLLKERIRTEGVELKWGFRRVPLSRGRHHGGYVCAFRCQPLLRVESALERHVLRALAADQGCVALATQPVTIQWTWRGTVRRYTPDVLVMLCDVPEPWSAVGLERLSLVEVKPTRFSVDDDLWVERVRVIKEALNMPLVRLATLPEALS
ncbi:hypothetical protein [Rhodanobacter sp. MP7CTX1]|uniref:hypothetical protein n=1 Tax=Rhodanobacter sp. MP7CTX1 TaxID=2723084 RepID=UPI00160701DA|nr:hypothetical protein [Rhodanobacter sp. MP7CTX1]